MTESRLMIMTKEEFEKMPRGKEITCEDYICTNINPDKMAYTIRIKPNAEYVVMKAKTTPIMYFIIVNNEIRPLNKEVVKFYKQAIREYEKYGV